RLKLIYFGDRSLEMAIPVPIPSTYQGLSGEEAVEAEEDFYFKWRFHVFILTGKERWACLCTLVKDRVEIQQRCEGKMDYTADSHSDTEGRTCNDNVIWVKGNCLQRYDEEPLDLQFKIVKQSVNSSMERKESLLDEVAEEETELELVLEGLGLSRKKRVDSKSDKVRRAQSTRSMTGVDEGKKKISGEEVRTNLSKTPGSGSLAPPTLTTSKIAKKYPKKRMLKSLPASGATESGEVTKEKRRVESSREKVVLLVKGIWLGIEEEKSELKKAKSELEKAQAQAKTEAIKEVRQLKASYVMAIGQLQAEAKVNLDEMLKERNRLGHHLMLKGYSKEEVDAIKADTYVEEGDDEEAEAVGVVDGLDGISRQTVLDNQGDDIELPEGGSEKVEEKDSETTKGLKELSEVIEHAEKLQRQVDALVVKGRQADMAQYHV
ncbi:hypothetical protein GIB67_040224, partial [Kingdonia uniflora]